MLMGPRLRKLALTSHIGCSVGLLGAVAAFLSLAIAGLASTSAAIVDAVYQVLPALAWSVVLPLSVASLLSGLIQSLGTVWGLFRHYWVVAKLLLTCLVIAILLLQLQLIDGLAGAARRDAIAGDALFEARASLVAHAGGGLLVLLLPVILSVYKPRGLTPYGESRSRQR